jgi:hypothetical protein
MLQREPCERDERDARTRGAEMMARRWGCPRRKHTPPTTLPRDLAMAAEDHERVTGVKRCGTCPWSRSLSPWALQVLKLHRVGRELKGAVSAREVLGRPPHVWDVAALDALILADAERHESDERIREREREQRQPRT